jgi:drug/metabolite transporter (DMT)-like permease
LSWKHQIGGGCSCPGDSVRSDGVPVGRDKRLSEGWAFWIFIGLILTNIFWGASGVAVKVALNQLDFFEIVAYRFITAAVLLFLITLIWKGRQTFKVKRRDLPLLALLAFLGIPLEFLLQVVSLANTTVTNFTLIFCLAPFFIIFGSAMLTKERVTRNKILGTVLAFIGVAFVVVSGGAGLTANLLGDGIALLACIIWAAYTVVGKPINQRYTTVTVLNYVFIFGALEMLPFLMLSPLTVPTVFSSDTWISMVFLTIFCSLAAFFMYNDGVEKLPASTVGMFIYLNPLAGVLLAAIVLGESVTALSFVGMALIILGIYVSERLLMYGPHTVR